MPASQAGRRGFESHRPLLTEVLPDAAVKRTHLRRMVRLDDPSNPVNYRVCARKGLPHMSRRFSRIPNYRLHKPSGQAVVTLNNKDHYLGQYNSPESRAEYDRLIAEYLASRLQAGPTRGLTAGLSVSEMILAI